jgi:hypothetical protein
MAVMPQPSRSSAKYLASPQPMGYGGRLFEAPKRAAVLTDPPLAF